MPYGFAVHMLNVTPTEPLKKKYGISLRLLPRNSINSEKHYAEIYTKFNRNRWKIWTVWVQMHSTFSSNVLLSRYARLCHASWTAFCEELLYRTVWNSVRNLDPDKKKTDCRTVLVTTSGIIFLRTPQKYHSLPPTPFTLQCGIHETDFWCQCS
jgi:hypothetical protein